MMDEEYKIACTEVLEVMNYVSKEDYNKVPKDVIQVLEKNKKDDLVFLYNPWKDINEQGISKTGRIMLASFFRDYWATEEQKNKIKAFQTNKRYQIEEEKRKKYDNDIFKNKKNTLSKVESEKNENVQLAEYKENILYKFINFIKKVLKR